MASKKSIYLSDENIARLESVAATYSLYDKHNQLDILSAMRYVIEHFELAKNANKTENIEAKISKIETMLEQIHVAIPHIVYQTRYALRYCNAAMNSNQISSEIMNEFKINTVNDTVKICGDYQQYQYQNLFVSCDNKNMKTIPIEEDKNQWK